MEPLLPARTVTSATPSPARLATNAEESYSTSTARSPTHPHKSFTIQYPANSSTPHIRQLRRPTPHLHRRVAFTPPHPHQPRAPAPLLLTPVSPQVLHQHQAQRLPRLLRHALSVEAPRLRQGDGGARGGEEDRVGQDEPGRQADDAGRDGVDHHHRVRGGGASPPRLSQGCVASFSALGSAGAGSVVTCPA